MDRKRDTSNAKVNGNARFSLLSPGLVRMEFSPVAQFEDRTSIRAMNRPDPIPFSAISKSDTEIQLSTPLCTVHYRFGTFDPRSLYITDAVSGQTVWRYGQVDQRNLGGAFLSMDVVNRRLIPDGVHEATSDPFDNSDTAQLWRYKGILRGLSENALSADNYKNKLLEEILATSRFEELHPDLQRLVRMRSKFPPGLLSRSGYFLYNDSASPVIDPSTSWISDRKSPAGSLDLYFFYYGNNFKAALADYQLLFGPAPHIPRYTLGLWYSRYPTFNQQGLMELMGDFEKHDLPLDVLVLDLEWHLRGWNGFDWDLGHIPDPQELLASMRKNEIHTAFNVHPYSVPVADSRFGEFMESAGIAPPDTNDQGAIFSDFDASCKPHAQAFLDVLHKPVQDQGMDFWWIDGMMPMRDAARDEGTLWSNHVYFTHCEETYTDRKPLILSRSPGPGAHRYPIHFTGDTMAQWEVLRSQVEHTLRAGHIGQSFISHDIGGHIAPYILIDQELFVRWCQFGALSPIMRLHSSGGGERRPWLYDPKVLDAFKAAMRLRMSLVPYMYTLVWESTQTGLPMCRSNCIERPSWNRGYELWDSYFLGDRIYATPIVAPGDFHDFILPPGTWYYSRDYSRLVSDGATPKTIVASLSNGPPHFYAAGTLIVKQPYVRRACRIPQHLDIELYCSGLPGENSFALYEDDGMTQAYRSGAHATTIFIFRETPDGCELHIGRSKGSFEGKPVARSYTITVIGEDVTFGAVKNSELRQAASHLPNSKVPSKTFLTEELTTAEDHTIVFFSEEARDQKPGT